ncbi:immunodominant staphylococcal antigen IsaB family protein [Macrococcus animalis]|uniref:immunodominant staphylococcal antigen IsaB family protein n=1 Tax=Macrococcus animalis TaxID=3395467 RepID=UPI0039BE9FF8
MNTILKLGIASTLLLGMSPAVADAKTPTQVVTPYYKWNGYSGNSYQFVLDKDFKRALLNSNVTVNGMKATKPKKISMIISHSMPIISMRSLIF